MHFLEAGERCKMDDGYRGSAPFYAKCPGVIEANPDKAEMQQRVRNLLNLWLTSKSMNRLITNYEAVYSSNG